GERRAALPRCHFSPRRAPDNPPAAREDGLRHALSAKNMWHRALLTARITRATSVTVEPFGLRYCGVQPIATKSRRSFGKSDCIDMAAVIGFAAVHGPPIAEEQLRIGVGAVAEILELPNSGGSESRRDKTSEIEQGVVRPP